MSQATPLVIIPAAGFGRRMGSPEAKEILLNNEGRPFIEKALLDCEKRNWPVCVVTREQKRTLIDYLSGWRTRLNLTIHLIEESKEWADTVLRSQNFWREKNILYLPDVDFSPTKILDILVEGEFQIRAATFKVSDPENWGVLQNLTSESFEICDKPVISKADLAWGLFSFKKDFGAELFKACLESKFDHEWRRIHAQLQIYELAFFKDLTRNSQV